LAAGPEIFFAEHVQVRNFSAPLLISARKARTLRFRVDRILHATVARGELHQEQVQVPGVPGPSQKPPDWAS
jgi:hypothetical protein